MGQSKPYTKRARLAAGQDWRAGQRNALGLFPLSLTSFRTRHLYEISQLQVKRWAAIHVLVIVAFPFQLRLDVRDAHDAARPGQLKGPLKS